MEIKTGNWVFDWKNKKFIKITEANLSLFDYHSNCPDGCILMWSRTRKKWKYVIHGKNADDCWKNAAKPFLKEIKRLEAEIFQLHITISKEVGDIPR
jgi:hypothetical protein